MELDAPIVAVTVYPKRARVIRRGRVAVPAGRSEIVVAGLTRTLLEESLRVSLTGTAALLGVDVVRRDVAEVSDERVRAAEAAVRDAERAVAAVDGADAGEAAREELLTRLAGRSGDRLAAALADGRVEPDRVATVGEAVAAQLTEVAARRRDLAERRADAERAVAAAQAELGRLTSGGRTHRDARIAVEAEAAGEVDVEVGYVVTGASWSSAYDARLDDPGSGEPARLTLTWHGMVTQQSGEDWPECALALSTARPSVDARLPELEPWWIDVFRPVPPGAETVMQMTAGPVPASPPRMRAAAREAVEAEPEEGLVAATWRVARPVAVAADGTPHRTTVTTVGAEARLDHLTAPALSADVHLRATVRNTSGHVLPAGPVSTFLDDAYVGTTRLDTTAPDGEIELPLGLDDRVVVERELESRTTRKVRFGSHRGATQVWRTTVTNRRAAPARVVVRDRLPVSRAVEVKVVDVELAPEPAERDELGRCEWVAHVEPGATWELAVRFGVEHPKEVAVVGWR